MLRRRSKIDWVDGIVSQDEYPVLTSEKEDTTSWGATCCRVNGRLKPQRKDEAVGYRYSKRFADPGAG